MSERHGLTEAKIVGEAFPVIMSAGKFFNDMQNPQPVVQVGDEEGQRGWVEWSDMIVSTQGEQAGAILIQWNMASAGGKPSGMWDVHVRIGGFEGSQLQVAECLKTPGVPVDASNISTQCIAAFMSMHITKPASGLYMENCWIWVADHDVDDAQLTQITIYAGRGLLVESTAGGIWLVGTGVEHHVMYEYQFVETKDIFMGQIQTETAYYQPNPDARLPFPARPTYHDPGFAAGEDGWGLRVVDSRGILVYGAGYVSRTLAPAASNETWTDGTHRLYSFFDNWDNSCADPSSPQKCQSRIFSSEGSQVSVYGLNTVGTTYMVTENGREVTDWSANQAGFVSSVALYRSTV